MLTLVGTLWRMKISMRVIASVLLALSLPTVSVADEPLYLSKIGERVSVFENPEQNYRIDLDGAGYTFVNFQRKGTGCFVCCDSISSQCVCTGDCGKYRCGRYCRKLRQSGATRHAKTANGS